MKTKWAKRFCRAFLLVGLAGAGIGLVGCADEYAAYPGYRGGYYASYHAGYPYYSGYGYPYRAYGPYYGSYYGGYPYYGTSVVVSGSNHYAYRDRYGRVYTRRHVNRIRNNNRTTRRTETTRTTRTRSTVPRYQQDDERRYYTPQ
jgi:hypothetical protein